MKISIMTLFPEMFTGFMTESIIGKAINKKIIDIELYNIRDYTKQKSNSVDDYVYGGGNGMLMMAQPICDCYKHITKNSNDFSTYYLSPKGEVFNQKMATDIAKEKNLIFLCGHYEGVDERAIKFINAKEISIGDYVLTGGELPCMIIIDAISRYVNGVLSNSESVKEESFYNGLLEYPQYTRPYEYEGLKVPDILLSGDHKKISDWRLEKSLELTKLRRPDLYEKYINKLKNNN